MAEGNGLITRGEMDAHMKRIEGQLVALDERMKKVEDAVGANARWLSARVTKTIDQLLPIALTAIAIWFIAHA